MKPGIALIVSWCVDCVAVMKEAATRTQPANVKGVMLLLLLLLWIYFTPCSRDDNHQINRFSYRKWDMLPTKRRNVIVGSCTRGRYENKKWKKKKVSLFDKNPAMYSVHEAGSIDAEIETSNQQSCFTWFRMYLDKLLLIKLKRCWPRWWNEFIDQTHHVWVV